MSTPPPNYNSPYGNNPYAPPQAAAPFPVYQQPFPVGDPLFGLFRQGNVLVMHKLAPLPDKCIKSNQPAHGRTLRRNLRWHPPAVFFALLAHFIIYIILAAILTKSATINIGLSEEWFARRRRVIMVAWGLVLLGVAMFVGGIAIMDAQPNVGPWLLLSSVFVFIGGAIYGITCARLVSPSKITDTHVWLKGAHPDYLDGLPNWPYAY